MKGLIKKIFLATMMITLVIQPIVLTVTRNTKCTSSRLYREMVALWSRAS